MTILDTDIRQWSLKHLVHNGAATVCPDHGFITVVENIPAVHQAVSAARQHPLPGISADGAELAILETYLSLPEHCPVCKDT